MGPITWTCATATTTTLRQSVPPGRWRCGTFRSGSGWPKRYLERQHRLVAKCGEIVCRLGCQWALIYLLLHMVLCHYAKVCPSSMMNVSFKKFLKFVAIAEFFLLNKIHSFALCQSNIFWTIFKGLEKNIVIAKTSSCYPVKAMEK